GERLQQAACVQHPDNPQTNSRHVVLCLPARDQADELTATMFAQVLHMAGVTVDVGSEHTLAGEALAYVDKTAASLVCVCALPPGAVSHARYLCRRLHDHDARVPVIVGLWNAQGNVGRMRARLLEAGAGHVATTLDDGADQIRRRLSGLTFAAADGGT
ncbi:MAG: hypothetical protein L0H19_08895, partial [Salinisphaera sp.]|nr:hypothetical protein [Salinisphaera sp.]